MSREAITLGVGAARLEISRHGAEARVWRVGEVELLWPGDPAIWNEISPILYPVVVGWTRDGVRVNGQHYPARAAWFRPQSRIRRRSGRRRLRWARLTLRDDEETRALYPFAFELAIEYRLADMALTIAIEVANPGDTPSAPMPAACIQDFAGPSPAARALAPSRVSPSRNRPKCR